MRNLILFIIIFSTPLVLCAQALQHERVYVSPDQASYSVNDTIHINGILLNEYNKPEVYSNYVYIDIINPADSVISHQKVLRNDNGTFNVDYITEPDCKEGMYYVRAYTRFMLNFHPSTIPSVPIAINRQFSSNLSNSLDCQFFPEGKNVGNGVIQRIGIYLSTTNGHTEEIPFTISDDEGTQLESSSTSQSGWKTVSVMPNYGKSLYLNTNYKGNKQKFLLPTATDKEHIRLMAGKKNIIYEIHGLNTTKQYSLFLYSPSLGLLRIPTVSEHGSCLIDGSLKGVITMILTDETGNIISETSAWHDYTESNISTGATSLTRYIAVNTPQIMMNVAEQQLYFENDLLSPVPFPTTTYLTDKKERQEDLTPWLFSTSFSRLNMKDAVKGDFEYCLMPETSMQIGGVVMESKNRRLKKGKIVALSLDNGMAEEVEIGKDGKFVINLPDFYMGDTFILRAKEYENDDTKYNIQMDADSIPSFINNKEYSIMKVFDKDDNAYTTEHDAKILSELQVTAKAKRVKYNKNERFFKHRYIESDDIAKYNIIQLRNLIQTFFNIYMRLGEDKYLISYRPSVLTSIKDVTNDDVFLVSNEIPVVLDGTQMHFYDAECQCSIDDIVSVEYLSPAQTLAEPGCVGCVNGALVIKTGKKYTLPQERKGIYYTPTGLSTCNSITTSKPSDKGEYYMIEDHFTTDGCISSQITKIKIQ